MRPPLGLLREQPRLITGFASVPRAQIVEAVTEIVAYAGGSRSHCQVEYG